MVTVNDPEFTLFKDPKKNKVKNILMFVFLQCCHLHRQFKIFSTKVKHRFSSVPVNYREPASSRPH